MVIDAENLTIYWTCLAIILPSTAQRRVDRSRRLSGWSAASLPASPSGVRARREAFARRGGSRGHAITLGPDRNPLNDLT